MKIFELFGSIFVETDQANESMDKTDSKAKGIASSLGEGVKTAAKWSAAIVGGAVAAGGALLKAGSDFADTTDSIDKMSQKLGLSRQGFQEWEFILSQSGASIEGMKAGMTQLNNSFDELKKGTGAGADAFARLGLSMDDLAGMSQEQVFESTIKALQGVTDESERAAIANDLLGKSAVELAPVFNTSAEGIETMKEQASELGLIIGDEAIDTGVQFQDTLDQVKRAFSALTTNLMAGLMPTLQMFLGFVIEDMPLIQQVMQDVFAVLGSAVQSIMPFLMQLIQDLLPPLVELFKNLAINLLPVLIEAVTALMTNVLPVLIEVFNILVQTVLPSLVQILSIIITTVLPPLIDLFTKVLDAILPVLIDLFTTLSETVLPPLIKVFETIIENVLPLLIEIFNQFVDIVLPPLIDLINLIVQEILPPLLAIFMELAEAVLPIVMEVFEALMPVVEPIMNVLAAVIKTVLALIKGDWEGVWEGIQEFFGSTLDAITAAVEGFADIFGGIFQGIADVVGGIWDGLVEGIKGGINWIISGINTFINGLNKLEIPDWVPVVGGKGINLPRIPMLAEGGNIIQSGRVLVGERGPEFLDLPAGARVTPLGKAAGVTLGHGAFAGAIIMDDYGVDRLMDRVMQRAVLLGVR